MPFHYNITTLLLLDISPIMICNIFLPTSHLVVTLIDQLEVVVHIKVHCKHLGMPLLFKLPYHNNGVAVLTIMYPIILNLIIFMANLIHIIALQGIL